MIKVLKVLLGTAVAIGGCWEGANIATSDALKEKLNNWVDDKKEVNADDTNECSDEGCEE